LFIRLFLPVVLALTVWPLVAGARTILVLGDSLSAAYNIDIASGWVARLQQRLNRQQLPYHLVNASISGDTTAGALARLPKLLTEHRPDVVLVELGGNDGLRGLTLEQMQHNLTAIVVAAKTAGAKVLLLGIRLPPNYGSRYTERFQRVYRTVAAEQKVPLVPFILEGVATDSGLMQPDGIHPNAAAQPRILDTVWKRLRPML
jgi:acyl-CoA thioesterase-1